LAAEQAFRDALHSAADWPLFTSWSSARIALVRLALGDASGAAPHVLRSLTAGPPLAHYEARLAHAELAAALGQPDAAQIARDALALAEAGGHLASIPRLRELAPKLTASRPAIGNEPDSRELGNV
jgi:hypothetical protein